MRRSRADGRNKNLGNWTEWATKRNNLDFFEEALRVMGDEYGLGNKGLMTIGLIGSRDLPGVTLRQAQGVLRWDRRPSLWSHVFLLADRWDGKSKIGELPLLELPLHARTVGFRKPENNGLTEGVRLKDYADPVVDANVALVTVSRAKKSKSKGKAKPHAFGFEPLTDEEALSVAARANDPNFDRLRYDLWDSLCTWQRFLWSDGTAQNPLRAGIPVCGSAFVEMAFEAVGIDLVPGASERNSAPEHVWNAAVWWHKTQETSKPEDGAVVMFGCYAHRDPGCSTLDTDLSTARKNLTQG